MIFHTHCERAVDTHAAPTKTFVPSRLKQSAVLVHRAYTDNTQVNPQPGRHAGKRMPEKVLRAAPRLGASIVASTAFVSFRRICSNPLHIGLIACCVGSAPYAAAQYTTGIVSGTALDASHAPVRNAAVLLESLDTAERRTASTGNDGVYSFASVPSGHYRLTVQSTGFAPQQIAFEVFAGQTASRTVQLQLPSVATAVSVEANDGSALESDSPLRGVTNTATEITTLPNGARNIVALVSLAPGATPNFNPRGGGLIAINGAQAGQITANGGRAKASSTQLDFTDANDWEWGGIALGTQPTPDMLSEFQVLTANWSAQYGVRSSSEVLMVTRSGGDALHGTAYDFAQNAAFNARDYFDTTGRATPLVQNLYGFAAGGPIVRHRAFWFAGYERQATAGAGSTLVIRLPSAAARSTVTDASVRQLLLLLPDAATQTTDPLVGTSTVQAPNPTTGNRYLARVDQTINDRHHLTLRYFDSNAASVLRVSSSLPQFDAAFKPIGKNAMVAESWTPTSRFSNEARLAYGRSSTLFEPLTTPATARFNVTGLTPFGTVEYWPQGRTFNVYQVSDTVTLARGAHLISAGIDLRSIQDNSINNSDSRGVFSFASVNDFLAGRTAVFTQEFGNTYRGYRQHFHGAFVQDDYKLAPTFTLNAGLRWEFQGGQSDANNLQSVLDTQRTAPIGNLGTGVLGSFTAAKPLIEPHNFLLGPRFGFSWSPAARQTAVRGGYGIYYDSLLFDGLQGGRTSPPADYTGTLTSFTGGNTLAALLAGSSPFQKSYAAQVGGFTGVTSLGSVTSVNPRLRNPYAQQFSLGVQQALGSAWVLDAAYVGTRGSQLSTFGPINSITPARRPRPAISVADQTARLAEFQAAYLAENGPGNARLDPRFDAVNYIDDRGSSTYHSLQTSVRHDMRHGLMLRASYTWSHSMDNSSDSTPAQAATDFSFAQNQFRPDLERGNSAFDIRHRFTLSHVWQLPWLAEQHGLAGRTLGGWTFASIDQVQSGIPFTVINGPTAGVVDTNLDGNLVTGLDNTRATCVTNGTLTMASPGSTVRNTLYQQTLLGNDGSCGRNLSRLNSLVNFDWTFSKSIRLGGKQALDSGPFRLEYRADILNALNNRYLSVLGNDYRTLGSSGFGLYNTAAISRRVQMSLRLNW